MESIINEAQEKIYSTTGVRVTLIPIMDGRDNKGPVKRKKRIELLEPLKELICREFGEPWEKISGKKRGKQNVSDARQCYCFIAHKKQVLPWRK